MFDSCTASAAQHETRLVTPLRIIWYGNHRQRAAALRWPVLLREQASCVGVSPIYRMESPSMGLVHTKQA